MTIYEDDIKENIWSTLLEDYEEDICEYIAENYYVCENEEGYEDFIEEAIHNVVDEDEFWSKCNDGFDCATTYDEDCIEWLDDNIGLEDAVNGYMGECGIEVGSFDLRGCTIYHLSEIINYNYDDCITDILYGFIEMKENDTDEKPIQCIVERIVDAHTDKVE